ncbi:hypothetical protein V2J09_011586 [Rumex salicifolius]
MQTRINSLSDLTSGIRAFFDQIKTSQQTRGEIYLSASYRLYDPESKKIVVSRDVVFEEDEKWNWDSSYKELIDSELEWEPELDAVEETKGGSNEDDVPSSPGMPHLAANLSSSVASPGSGNSSVPTAATTDRNSVPAAATTGRERRVPAWMQDYEFEMTDLGRMKYFLGIEVKQLEEGIFISQRKYVTEVLKRFGMENSNPVWNPMTPEQHLPSIHRHL